MSNTPPAAPSPHDGENNGENGELRREESQRPLDADHQEAWLARVEIKERRKIRARRTQEQSIWFGLGMFGTIGWSIVVPALLGILIGLWLDARYPSSFSWTIALLFAGVTVGILNAWYWISREREMIEQGRNNESQREIHRR